MFFGGGLGMDYERYGTGYTTTAPLVQLHVGYTFATTRRVRAQVLAVITDASTGYDLGSTSSDDLVCARVVVGLQL